MTFQIRRGLFETNSSSIHSMVLCTEDEYNRWLAGELAFDIDEGVLTTDLKGEWSYVGEDFEKINNTRHHFDDRTGHTYVDADYKLVTLSDGTKVGLLEYDGDI